MGGGVLLLSSFEFTELMEPRQAAFDEPTSFAKTAAVVGSTLGQQRFHPLFLMALRCGSES